MTTSKDLYSAIKNMQNESPIRIIEGTIKLDSEKMEIGKYYPIKYQGNNYIFSKTKEGIIDIYVEEYVEE